MDRSLLSLTNDVCFCVSGTVTIHPTAAIATNVVLHANPGSCIIIGAGAVIGRGSILHAEGGTLNIDSEVVLGTKVLLVGCGVVGKNACIGSMTTIMMGISIHPGQVIPPNSLIGVPEPVLQPKPVAIASPATDAKSGSGFPASHRSSLRSSGFPRSSESDRAKARIDALLEDVQFDSSQYNGGNRPHDNGCERQLGAHGSVNKDSVESESSSPNHEPVNGKRGNEQETEGDRTIDKPVDTKLVESEQGRTEQADVGQADVEKAGVEQNVAPNSTTSEKTVVYGQASVQRLITMMFPHRSLDNTGEDKE